MKNLNRNSSIFTALIGNILEFYDLGLYGFYAAILYSSFFPASDPFIKSLASLGIFSAGFIMRPLGSIVFGYIGDVYGRKRVLVLTLYLTSISSLLIGILPTYQEIGIVAPLFLTLLRLTQGFCTGGEYNTSAIFVLEHTPKKYHGTLSGVITTTAILGFFLSSLVMSLTSIDTFPTWGWRIPFIFGGLIAFVGYKIRRRSFEAGEFLSIANQRQKSIPLLKAFKENRQSILSTLGVGLLAGVLSLMMIGFLQTYIGGFLHDNVNILCQIGILFYICSLLVSGHVSDYKGYKRVMSVAALSSIFLSLPTFILLSSGQETKTLVGIIVLAVIAGLFLGPMHAYMFSIFPPEKRCSSISFCFSISVALFGGTTPIISMLLTRTTGMNFAPAFYVILISSIYLLMESRRISSPGAYQNLKPIGEEFVMRPRA